MGTEGTKRRSGQATTQDSQQSTEEHMSPEALNQKDSSREPSYTASIYPGKRSTIPSGFAKKVLRLEEVFSKESAMKTQIWLLLQGGKSEVEAQTEGGYGGLNEDVRRAFFSERDKLSQSAQLVLLIDSLGGQARSAFQLAMFFRRYCGRFVALVPRSAKSAATLLTIGADDIMLGNSGELGPVDAQVPEGDHYVPALDRVKLMERQHVSALEALDRVMALLTLRSGQNIKELIPVAVDFAARLSQPYLEKTDMVDYTRMSRVLKIGEDYASKLLERQYQASKQDGGHSGTQGDHQPPLQEAAEDAALDEVRYGDYGLPSRRRARLLAQHLVGAYPDHDFAIDVEEAKRINLQVRDPSKDMAPMIDELHQLLADRAKDPLTAFGRVVKVKDE